MGRDTGGAHGDALSANQRPALAGGDQSQPCIAARAPAGSDARERLGSQLTMGGCCSKLNISGPGAGGKGLETDVDKTRTGDTPKLSRLQHKESFSNGHVKSSDHHNGVTNGGPGATPSLTGTQR